MTGTANTIYSNTDSTMTLDALIMDYTAGTLSPAQMLMMDSYVTLNKDIRAQCRQMAHVGGVMLDADCGAMGVSESCLSGIMNKIDPIIDNEKSPEICNILTQSIVMYTQCDSNDIAWKHLAPGIEYFDLSVPCARREKAQLIKMAPGKSVLEHSHDGLELTLVLDGAFYDNAGAYHRGDLAIEEGHSHSHKPVADNIHGCICLAVTSAPLHFTGLLGRLINPFIK